jgi:peptide/nickel transport system substrate-binding protein
MEGNVMGRRAANKLNRREFLAASAGTATMLGLAACTPGTTTPPPATDATARVGGQAVITGAEEATLLVGATRSAGSIWIFNFIANGLTRVKYPDMSVAPDLAESWTASPDGLTYTFTLKKGVKFHDGQPFTARDVKFTFETLAHPTWPGALTSTIIEGADAFKKGQAREITGIKVLADDKIEFRLIEPSNLFLATNATLRIMPQHVLKDVSPADMAKHAFARKPIYTGPFMVDEWRGGESIRYKAITDFPGGRAKLDSLVQRFIPDPATAIAELRSGGIHQHVVNADQIGEFERDTNAYEVQELPGAGGWFIAFDTTKPMFADKRVRMAMNHAVDRKALVTALFGGRGEESYTLSSPLSWLYNPNTPRFPFDVAKAKALLDEAGWIPGTDGVRAKGGERLSFTINVGLFTPAVKDWAIAVQPFLRAVGIETQVNPLDLASFFPKQVVGQYQAGFTGWVNFTNDPRNDLQQHFETPRPTNQSGYNDPAVNALFKQARAAKTQEEEKRVYGEIQRIAEGEALYLHLFRVKTLVVTRKNLTVPKATLQAELYSTIPGWHLR